MGTKKYHVMIVEDEVLLRDSIARKVEDFSPEFCVVGTAADGEEALAMLRKFKPDIIITDIVMPTMDGLDFIKKAIELDMQVQFVVLSGYSDFEYAKKAIQCGVRDYLLKPLSEKALQEILLKLAREIDNKMDTTNSYFYSLLNNPYTQEMDNFYSNAAFYIMLICMGNFVSYHANQDVEEFFDSFWQSIDIHKISLQIDQEHGNPFISHSIYPNERVLIFENPDFPPAHLKQYAEILCEYLNTDFSNLPMSVCYTSSAVTAKDFYISVKKLRKLYYLNYIPWKPQCFHLSTCNESLFVNKSVSAVKIDNIIQYFQNGLIQTALQELTSTLQSWLKSGVCLDRFFSNLQYLIQSLQRFIPQTYEALWDGLCQDIYLSLAISNNSNSFFAELNDLLEKYFTIHLEDNSNEHLIKKVKKFIDENFNKPISMLDISNCFHISSSHLSRLFKSVYGQSPINYLISLRIQEACELMQKYPDLEFKHISELIGYSDQHYFSKLFKKHTGLSPTEYRNSIYKNNNDGTKFAAP
jgi:two-component system response regulator YesN